jgi:6-phosphofructokinase 2
MGRIVTCTVNPAIDVFACVDRIEPVRKLRCSGERRDPGGGGINVARAVHRLGGEVAAIFAAGGPAGELLRALVEAEGIQSIHVPIRGPTREDFTIWERQTGKEFRFVFPGPELSGEECAAIDRAVSSLRPHPEFVVFSGSLPPNVPPTYYGVLVRQANVTGARVVADTSGEALADALTAGVYLIKPNLREFRELTRLPLDTEHEMIAAARTLIDAGRTAMVALSLAERGALLIVRDGAWLGRAPRTVPVSTVGAGDSFLGALIQSLAAGRELPLALRYGIAAGTAALLSPGTELCRKADVENLLPQIAIERV